MQDAKIIIVEDIEGLRILLKTLLECFLKTEVLAFINGLDAWEYLEENHQEVNSVHVIISDVNMPFMTGLQLLEKTKAKYPEIIFVVTSAEPENAKLAEELGADAFIGKPYKVDDFILLIKRSILGET